MGVTAITIYPNPNCKKVRGIHVLTVSCAHCKAFIAHYQKVEESNFVKMLGERIAIRYMTKMDNKEAYHKVST